jgi:hypothetical protein
MGGAGGSATGGADPGRRGSSASTRTRAARRRSWGLPRRGWAATPAPSCEGPRPCTAAPMEGAAPGGRSLPGAAAAQVGGGCSWRLLQWEGRKTLILLPMGASPAGEQRLPSPSGLHGRAPLEQALSSHGAGSICLGPPKLLQPRPPCSMASKAPCARRPSSTSDCSSLHRAPLPNSPTPEPLAPPRPRALQAIEPLPAEPPRAHTARCRAQEPCPTSTATRTLAAPASTGALHQPGRARPDQAEPQPPNTDRAAPRSSARA